MGYFQINSQPNQQKHEHGRISDALYQRASQVFSEQELCDVIFSIAQINAWNRLGVAFHTEIGSMDKMMGLDNLQL